MGEKSNSDPNGTSGQITLSLISFLISNKINLLEWETMKCNADLCLDIEGNKIIYTSKKDVHGFKIKHNGCLGSIINGELIEYKFKNCYK